MGMNVGSSAEDEPIVDVNTTPLIDLMLVLIVMLIMTLPPQTHAVKLDLPVMPATNPPTELPEVVNIEIDFDNTITWNGSKVESAETLQRYFRIEAAREKKSEVHLRPNKLAKYDAVAKVLATAKRLGVNNIGIMGNEQLD